MCARSSLWTDALVVDAEHLDLAERDGVHALANDGEGLLEDPRRVDDEQRVERLGVVALVERDHRLDQRDPRRRDVARVHLLHVHDHDALRVLPPRQLVQAHVAAQPRRRPVLPLAGGVLVHALRRRDRRVAEPDALDPHDAALPVAPRVQRRRVVRSARPRRAARRRRRSRRAARRRRTPRASTGCPSARAPPSLHRPCSRGGSGRPSAPSAARAGRDAGRRFGENWGCAWRSARTRRRRARVDGDLHMAGAARFL